ncbi:VOC family protein [Trinickia dinghuensis]|uniref:VOC family protein n=1 Tax=Trinickia dinghuensis TaxID=2291023 RepID=A0A3D8JPR7_9BURK|nr:VOC family protein [Trinickia dinghuensis]RDU95099.1 VOC family protein [Trinickia dinghuensis]
MQKITPFLWFDDQAEQAAAFYTSVFERSKIVDVMHYPDAGEGGKGRVMSVTFELDGQTFIALNGGPNPQFAFSPAMSLFIHCRSQEEVDALWQRLGEGGERLQCGWLRDKFGVTWQVVPTVLGGMLRDEDHERAARVMRAMMRMCKLDIAQLQRAYEGEGG